MKQNDVTPSQTPAISACLIVKNEAPHLARCLDSISGLASEIIIVDTGSTDETVSIAQSYTDKIFHHGMITLLQLAMRVLFMQQGTGF